LRGIAGFNPRLSAAHFLCCDHGASSCAAHGRLRLLLAWGRRKHGQGPGSQNHKEHRGDEFGEKSHASVVRISILSVLVCDLHHIVEHFPLKTSTAVDPVNRPKNRRVRRELQKESGQFNASQSVECVVLVPAAERPVTPFTHYTVAPISCATRCCSSRSIAIAFFAL
jgi:hypothetical protein